MSRRKSPRRGRVEDIFNELVYLPRLLMNPNFELEVALVDMEEYWIDDGKGSWRRRRWSIHDKKMLELHERHLFSSPEDFKRLIPETLPARVYIKDALQRNRAHHETISKDAILPHKDEHCREKREKRQSLPIQRLLALPDWVSQTDDTFTAGNTGKTIDLE